MHEDKRGLGIPASFRSGFCFLHRPPRGHSFGCQGQSRARHVFKINKYICTYIFKKLHVFAGCSGFLCFPECSSSPSLLSGAKSADERKFESTGLEGARRGRAVTGGHPASSQQTLRKNDTNEPESDFLRHALEGDSDASAPYCTA